MSAPSIHATAVAIDGEALLIVGPSRSGKSRLAAALIARATPARSIRLVGDDRVLLCVRGATLVASPHPRIAGFLERRGLGIVATDWTEEAPVGGVADIHAGRDQQAGEGSGRSKPFAEAAVGGLLADMPRLRIGSHDANADRVLAWWEARGAAAASHPPEKRFPRDRTCAKD